MAEVKIKIKEPVMIDGRHCARKEVVSVSEDDAAIVVGMGRAEYVKADSKSAKGGKQGSGGQGGQGGEGGQGGDGGQGGAGSGSDQ